MANVLERFQQDLGRPDSYLAGYLKQLQAKRDELVQVLGAIGMTPVVPEAGYFLLANWTRLEPLAQLQEEHDELRDFRFTKWLAKNVGVLALPGSIFYGEDSKRLGEDYARFCFVKVMREARRIFDRLESLNFQRFLFFSFRKIKLWSTLKSYYWIGPSNSHNK